MAGLMQMPNGQMIVRTYRMPPYSLTRACPVLNTS